MKKVRGQPITGATPETSMRKPFVPNAKDTSAATQTDIQAAPTPFKNKMEINQMPTGTGARGAVPGNGPKGVYSGKSGNQAPKLPQLGAVGQNRPINQSGQIGGKNGWPPPKRKAGSFPSGFKAKKGAAFYGE